MSLFWKTQFFAPWKLMLKGALRRGFPVYVLRHDMDSILKGCYLDRMTAGASPLLVRGGGDTRRLV